MNTQDAIELLGIAPEDDEREIKRKYHKMISRFHPDSLNEVGEAHIQRAQEINEAYRILSQSDSREMQNASCVACHTESLAAGKPAGPTDCKACHQAPSPLWAHEAEAGGSGTAAQ